MSKDLFARKVQDGWLVEIKDTRTVPTRDDVLKLIRQEGLKRHPEIVKDNIIAD
jgi:hypothetical protein